MPDIQNLLAALIHLREQAENIPLEDDSEAVDIAGELRYLIAQFSPSAHSPALHAALSDMDAAEGRIHEYLDTPQAAKPKTTWTPPWPASTTPSSPSPKTERSNPIPQEPHLAMKSPTITQFTEAVQNPGLSLQIPQLTNPRISRNQRGQPLVWAGNFAAVYQLQSNSTWALRCFTTPPNGKQLHCRLLDNALQNRNIPFLSPFLFHQEGILVSGRKFPVITMEWINGLRLDAKVPQLLNHPRQLRTLAISILNAAQSLEANGLAHNDLQHANIIVHDNGIIKLVDYYAFYLPQYQGRPTPKPDIPTTSTSTKPLTASVPTPTASPPSSSSSASSPSPPTRPSGNSITRTTSSSPSRISCRPKPPRPSTKQPEARPSTSGTSPTPSPASWPKAPTTPRPSTSSQRPSPLPRTAPTNPRQPAAPATSH